MNPFALAYREQQQLFIYDRTYLCGTLFKVGGLATLLARFIVQFFWNPKVAMAITLLLLALSVYMLSVSFLPFSCTHPWQTTASISNT